LGRWWIRPVRAEGKIDGKKVTGWIVLAKTDIPAQ
jgi:hypothetical protein